MTRAPKKVRLSWATWRLPPGAIVALVLIYPLTPDKMMGVLTRRKPSIEVQTPPLQVNEREESIVPSAHTEMKEGVGDEIGEEEIS